MADVGTGATLTLATSGWTADIESMSATGYIRDPVDTSHLGTTPARTFMPGDLHDPGELEIEFHLDPNNQPPYTTTAETVTVTFPIPAGDASGATVATSGFLTNFDYTIPLEDKMMGTVTIKLTGASTWADSST